MLSGMVTLPEKYNKINCVCLRTHVCLLRRGLTATIVVHIVVAPVLAVASVIAVAPVIAIALVRAVDPVISHSSSPTHKGGQA
jgi:hypothetical protein